MNDLERERETLIDLLKWHEQENEGDSSQCRKLLKNIKRAKSPQQLADYRWTVERMIDG